MEVGEHIHSVAWEADAVPANFLVVDDHPLFLEALRLSLGSAFPDAEVTEATSIADARQAISEKGSFDLVLLDLSMPGTSGFDGLLELRTVYPKLPVVICSALEDPRIIHEALSYGALGFISKSVRRAELASAIEEVMSGNVYLPTSYKPPAAVVPGSDLAQKLASLTPQQLRVLKMLRQGMLNKQIAYELNVGETTVKAHVSEILRKLNVASRTQAVIEVSKIDFESILAAADEDKP
ncbi:MAG: response regulator transcription factor [Hyphomicrobiaceae bacterium]|nr:response regulator transcription factor [Hyphomicrobiaceae bacterium]MCC0007311.1 response regulator transcription factor [Hyphomicrobiaceae bacterium]